MVQPMTSPSESVLRAAVCFEDDLPDEKNGERDGEKRELNLHPSI